MPNEQCFQTGSVVESSAVADGTVYVGSTESTACTINTADGSKKRSHTVSDTWGSPWTPAVANQTVYVGTDYHGDRLIALDTDDGTRRWGSGEGDEVTTCPAVVDGTVCTLAGSGVLRAISGDIPANAGSSGGGSASGGSDDGLGTPGIGIAALGLVGDGYIGYQKFSDDSGQQYRR